MPEHDSPTPDDEPTELFDLYVESVHAVSKPAHGRGWLICKSVKPEDREFSILTAEDGKAATRELANKGYEALMAIANEKALNLSDIGIEAFNALAELVDFPGRFAGQPEMRDPNEPPLPEDEKPGPAAAQRDDEEDDDEEPVARSARPVEKTVASRLLDEDHRELFTLIDDAEARFGPRLAANVIRRAVERAREET